mmetsp:Transcript_38388/g.96162  ORF Transcript_38388/g.96162 Transcript_38388/m.96162 type:complete len:86 (+) Transcript_38388:42-299(+)
MSMAQLEARLDQLKRQVSAVERELQERRDLERFCAVCHERHKTHAFSPCNHLCVCQACATSVVRSTGRCPICQQRIERTFRIYQS